MTVPEPPKLLTIILNYRTADMTLKSAKATIVAMENITGEILIVDNDSQDGSFEIIEAHIVDQGWDKCTPIVRVIQSGKNGGFGAGNNFGICTGLSNGDVADFFYILNPDAFPDEFAVTTLLNYLVDHPKIGIAGSYIHGEDGVTHLTTFRFPSIASEFEGAVNLGPVSFLLKGKRIWVDTPSLAVSVDWLAGASLMVRKFTLDEIGLFDENFFLYFEETDLCRRAALAGWATHFVPDSKVAHIGSAATGMKTWVRVPDYWFDSRLHYFVKNHGSFYAALATVIHLSGGFLNWIRCLLTGKKRQVAQGFLTSLATHDFRVLICAAAQRLRRGQNQSGVS